MPTALPSSPTNAQEISEILPWDLEELLESTPSLLLLDVREPSEFTAAHIPGSINIPRGHLPQACDSHVNTSHPHLTNAREKKVIIICRSGKRSILAAITLKNLGYAEPVSLKAGVIGWNHYEQPLKNNEGHVIDYELAEEIFSHTSPPR